MGYSAEEYKRMLKALLPRGKIWQVEDDSTLAEFLHGEGEEFARVDTRSEELIVESRVGTTNQLLTEHETDYGIPDECTDLANTTSERKKILLSKIIAVGQQDKDYFIEIALTLGYTITIDEFSPFICGVGVSGDPCGDHVVLFHWRVNIVGGKGAIIQFKSGSSQSGDPIKFLPGFDLLKCIFAKLKPAHTVIIWNVTGPAFSKAFSNAFDSIPSDDASFLQGAFNREFSSAFDVRYGGAFGKGFGGGFNKPA
jgi:uncharacterized protein YmfQ (DUF2313 family)